MTMTEEPTTEKKPAKRKAPKRKAKPATAPKVTAGPFAGLTVTDCCNECSVNGCVISGKPYCAHPRKGGLQSREIQDQAALKRLNGAKRLLGEQLLNARSE